MWVDECIAHLCPHGAHSSALATHHGVAHPVAALLVLEYCENGMLLDHVRQLDATLNTSMLLTYCRDVSCGMHYLSSRRIVHR